MGSAFSLPPFSVHFDIEILSKIKRETAINQMTKVVSSLSSLPAAIFHARACVRRVHPLTVAI